MPRYGSRGNRYTLSRTLISAILMSAVATAIAFGIIGVPDNMLQYFLMMLFIAVVVGAFLPWLILSVLIEPSH